METLEIARFLRASRKIILEMDLQEVKLFLTAAGIHFKPDRGGIRMKHVRLYKRYDKQWGVKIHGYYRCLSTF